ncbi:GNAT family N-acetyltransferase [Enterococcus plantarum]|uniref:GNAT family N-acetyltransferase n=1 Tax=Enterococcus plantarum TaxID=1077675 RepID=A0A2W3ZY06_9ENTE|nr:GNAT family N-acetyltransferase [Enterococcus plantarum]PZL73663.1 GNAT family N-acetyltransferase [Enterococcus plantarum]
MIIEEYNDKYLKDITSVWNDAITSGVYFPQENTLTVTEAKPFFESQDFTGVAIINSEVVGVYILHPNSIGRLDHVANASYAVKESARGNKIGERLVLHSIETSKILKYKILQFNAVVTTNQYAIQLYEKLGFTKIGKVPKSYRNISGEYEDILLYYIDLE